MSKLCENFTKYMSKHGEDNCPKCHAKGSLEYDACHWEGHDVGLWHWAQCSKCGHTFKVWYNMVFSEIAEVRDKDDNVVDEI